MAVKGVAAIVAVLVLVNAASASGQSVSAEVVQTIGHSTENTSAAATQFRLFGEAWAGVRFTTERAWGDRSANVSDAFGAAYPYDGRVKLMEAYGEPSSSSARASSSSAPVGSGHRSGSPAPATTPTRASCAVR